MEASRKWDACVNMNKIVVVTPRIFLIIACIGRKRGSSVRMLGSSIIGTGFLGVTQRQVDDRSSRLVL